MKDIVIIPAFNRPEYLFVTLSLLKECNRAKEMKYLFALDAGFTHKTFEVIKDLMHGWDYEIMYNNGIKYGAMKQSYNLLTAYTKAAAEAKEYVFLVEDDIFCGRSFFTSHYQIHAKHPDIFCSIGSKLHNQHFMHKPQTLNVSTCQTDISSIYQSWGVCFHKDIINMYIREHANLQYYTSPSKYMLKNFPNHFLKSTFTEQDGLLRRIADTSGLAIGYPDYPRCYHAGIWSYHRQGENVRAWGFEKRLKYIIDNCFDMNKMMKHNEFGDVFVADLKVDAEIK
jgi:hypothetical protein